MSIVSILPLKSIQSLSPGLYAPYKERTSHIFGNVWRPILDEPRTPLHCSCLAANMDEKQIKLETENK